MKTSSTPGSDDEGAVVSDNDLAQYMPQPDADGFIFPERILSSSNNNSSKKEKSTTPVSRNVPSWPDSTCIDLTDDDPLPISAAAVVPVVDSSEDEQEQEPTTRQHQQPRVESAFISSSSAASSSRETTPTPNTVEKSDSGYLDFDELMEDVEEEEEEEIDVTGMATSDEMDIQQEQHDMLTEEEYQLEEETALEGSRVKQPRPVPTEPTTTSNFDPGMEDDTFDDFDISAELSDVNSSIFESPAPALPPSKAHHRSSLKIPHHHHHQPSTTTTKVNDTTMIKTTARRIHLGKDMMVRPKPKKRRCNKLPTGYVYDICMFFHAELEPLDGDAPHPESPYRIYEIYKRLRNEGLLDQCVRIKSRYANRQEILNVHEFEHYDKMRALEGKVTHTHTHMHHVLIIIILH